MSNTALHNPERYAIATCNGLHSPVLGFNVDESYEINFNSDDIEILNDGLEEDGLLGEFRFASEDGTCVHFCDRNGQILRVLTSAWFYAPLTEVPTDAIDLMLAPYIGAFGTNPN